MKKLIKFLKERRLAALIIVALIAYGTGAALPPTLVPLILNEILKSDTPADAPNKETTQPIAAPLTTTPPIAVPLAVELSTVPPTLKKTKPLAEEETQ